MTVSYPVDGEPASPVGPLLVTASTPFDEKARPNGLRNPAAHTGSSGPKGLSAGTDPSGLYRRILPRTSAMLAAALDTCSSPRVTYSFPSGPKASRPPL